MSTQGRHAGTSAWPRCMEEAAGRQRRMLGRANPTHKRETMDLHRRADPLRSDLDRDVHDLLQKPESSERVLHETIDGSRHFGTPWRTIESMPPAKER